ncbi:MAG: hypothetical protein RMJ67_06605 [Elusimicrobiota bacterium]|nr:hypothetical protein [Endomicrobiia bacterium]MDW8166164.1 hypothetical protein [Elusimicrobiota bacterium]
MREEEIEEREEEDKDFETVETYYNPPKENVRWMFDYSKLYWEIRAKLMGGWLEEDKDGNFVIKKPKGVYPFLNKTGIEQTMAVINAFITKVQGLTFFDEDRIIDLCRHLFRELSVFYYINMEKFDLTPERAKIVIRLILDLYEANLRKSIGGLGIKLMGTTERIVETKQQERKKFLGII